MKKKLLPCPFCPESKVSVADNEADDTHLTRYFVCCGRCGSSSGHCKTEEHAIKLWNNRPHYKEILGTLSDLMWDVAHQGNLFPDSRTEQVKKSIENAVSITNKHSEGRK